MIIAGHRDTHFRALRNLRSGSPLQLQGRDGQWRRYQVRATRVVDSRVAMIDTRNLADGTLLLVTCYPFDSIDAGGPLRYVVEARLETPASPARRVEQIDTVAGL